jgi:hypothetical protein
MKLGAAAFAGFLALAACGGSKPAPESAESPPGEEKPLTELERRKAAGCEVVGKRLTECAVADAPEEKRAELKLEETAPAHTRDFIAKCTAQALSSRQVRVYEVCGAEAPSCDELLRCLDNVNPTSSATP